MKAAGIEKWPQDVLRHSFASAHYAFHRNPAQTALLLGHRDQDMLLTHYRDPMKPTVAARYWTIVPQVRAENIVPIRRMGDASNLSA
jgi:integrase